MKIIDALILVEHINRELESAVILKRELNNRGYSVKIASVFWEFGTLLVRYRPRIVITPWAYDSCEMRYILLFRGGLEDGTFFILNTHQEQITYSDAQNFMIPRGNARNCFHIAWGEYYKNLLLEQGIKEETVKITGSSRLELCSKEYWKLSADRYELAREYAIDPGKKWILIIGNFSFAYFPEKKIKSLYDRGNKAAFDIKNESIYALNSITEWLTRLCSESKGTFEIIYRPHPSEQINEIHKKLESRYSFFHLINEKTVRDWIVNSDVCFNWNSTSSVEAAFADKPVYALRPKKLESNLIIPLLNKLPIIDKYEAFLETISFIESGIITRCSEEFKNSLSFYYACGDQSPTKLTSDFIESILRSSISGFDSRVGDKSVYRYLIFAKQMIKNILRITGIISIFPKYKVQMNDHISYTEIRKIETALLRGNRS